MNKEAYLNSLKEKLKKLPKEEFQKAIDYFEEYFDEAGEENEQQAIEDLGTPQEAADKIIRDFAVENYNSKEAKKNVKKGFSGVWIAILAICASPIALPLLIAGLTIIFTFLLVVFVLLLTLGVVGIASVIAAPVVLIGGISIMMNSIANFMLCLGSSLFLGGFGVLLIYWTYLILRKFLYWIVMSFGRIVEKKGTKNESK